MLFLRQLSSSSASANKLVANLHPPYRCFVRQYIQKTLYDMNKVYFRQLPGNDQLLINFHYKNPDLNIDRDFNLVRNINENIELCLGRIKNNIEKELTKKSKKKVKKSEQVPVEIIKDSPLLSEISVKILKNDQEVDAAATFAALLSDGESNNLALQILDEHFQVFYNQPWVVNLSLPTSILSGYHVYCSKMEMQFANKSDSKGVWYRALMPKSGNVKQITQWEKIHEGLTYCSKNSDVGHLLKFELIPGNEGNYGPAVEIISKNVVEAGPGKCPFEDRHVFTVEKLNGNKFRVLSYNLLADLYADSDFSRSQLFPYCPPYALNIDYRKQLFIKEILGYNCDIISLQEVDCKIFDHDLIPILNNHNYDGVMQKKGQSGEGIVNFYRKNRFEMIQTHGINIGENIEKLDIFETLSKKIKNNEQLMKRIVDRATAVLVTVLKSKDTGKYLVVANTHLYFHPDADHIRLLQIGFCMTYIENIYRNLIEDLKLSKDDVSVIFNGDFNSTPECGIYRLMTQKFVDENCIDWKSNETEAVQNVSLKQSLDFKSAYGCPPFTNYTHAFKFCLDYIFYQIDNIQLEEVIPLPSEEELASNIAIPSVFFPSDHIALVADFKWKC